MNRRAFLCLAGAAAFGSLSGCGGHPQGVSLHPHLQISVAESIPVGNTWELTVRVRNLNGAGAPAHDMTLHVFDGNGDPVAEEFLGDHPDGGLSGPLEATLTTPAFPAIQTVTAEESPCDGARIEINFWVGPEDLRDQGPDYDEIVWDDVDRECDEPLPPERVLEQIGSRGD